MRRVVSKPDANTSEIVEGLRQAGATVEHVLIPNGGDLIVGFGQRNYILEIKNPHGFNRVSKGQADWHARWNGHSAIVRTLDEALREIGVR